jgi:hypothetical protein
MAQTDSIMQAEMKKYIFRELSEEERESFQLRFFEDSDLFYSLQELENDLADAYARNELPEDDRRRFEKAFEESSRLSKLVTISKAQQILNKEEDKGDAKISLRERIASLFNFNMSAMQYAAAGLIILLMSGIGFLIYERSRLQQEIASRREAVEKQERELQEKLADVTQREKNIQSELDKKNGQTDILSSQVDELTSEKEAAEKEKERLRDELEKLRKQKDLPPVPKDQPAQPPRPTITTIILTPFVRGKTGDNVKAVKITENTSQVSVTLQIPENSKAESFTVKFKGQTLAAKIKPRQTGAGNKFITVRIPVKQLSSTQNNLIIVTTDSGTQKIEYAFRLQR